MKHIIPHNLDAATARAVADRAFAEYQKRYPTYQPEIRWVTDQCAEIGFNAKGLRLRGKVDVDPSAIAFELNVPLLLRPFQKRAVEVIDREVRLWIDRVRAERAS